MKSSTDKTCVLYCRVSSLDQIEGTSLETQERICREYADRQGWDVVEVFIERGESAKSADRTELNRAIVLCKQQKVDFFVVYKLDRFARNQDDHVTVRALLRRSGTEVRSVTEPIDDTPIGRAMEGILSVFAELDNNIRAERTRQGMLARVKQGVWVWPSPFGYYRPERGKASQIIPDPEIAPYVQMAFEEYAKGIYTYEALAELLALRGLTTTHGRTPSKQLMQRILGSSVYCGVIRLWGEEYAGTFESLVSHELFQTCQRVRRRATGQPAAHSTDNPLFPLRRLVVCENCQRSLTGSVSTGRNARRYPYYHHSKMEGCPVRRSISKAELEDAFVRYLCQVSPNPRFERLFGSVVKKLWKDRAERASTEVTRLQREIAALEAERQEIFDLHRHGAYTNEEFREQLARNREKTKQKHALMRESVPELVDIDAALDACFGLVSHTAEVWKTLEASHDDRMCFQNLVFEGQVEFDGREFRNGDLSLVYVLVRESEEEKSRLVALVEQHWKQTLHALVLWTETAEVLKFKPLKKRKRAA